MFIDHHTLSDTDLLIWNIFSAKLFLSHTTQVTINTTGVAPVEPFNIITMGKSVPISDIGQSILFTLGKMIENITAFEILTFITVE